MNKILSIILVLFASVNIARASIDTDQQFEHAMGAFKSRNYGSAELIFKKIMDSGDDDYKDKAFFYHARSIFHQKKYKSAIFDFNSFLSQSKTATLSSEARFWLGESYYYQKEYMKAIEEYNRFISVAKDETLVPAAHDKIASIYYMQKRYDESIIEWNSSISISKDRDKNAYRIYHIGEALFREKKYDESLKRLYPILTSIASQKIVARAQLLIGRIYQKMNNHYKAINMFQSIPEPLLKDKDICEAQYFNAISCIKLKDTRKAVTLLDIFLVMGKSSPWYFNGKYDMGKLLIKTNDKTKGIEYLEDVRKSARKEYLRIGAAKILSDVYIKKDPSKAIPYLEESLSTEDQEKQKEIMLLLSKAYLKIHDYGKVETMLQQYKDKFPFDQRIDEVMFLHARVKLEKGEFALATQDFNKIEKDYPFSKFLNESKYYLAVAEIKRGRSKESITLLKTYLSNPNVKQPYYGNVMLLNAYVDANDLKNAEPIVNRLITKYLNHRGVEKSIFTFAVAIQNKGMNPWKYYNVIMTKFPKSNSAMKMYLRIGNDYYDEKKYREAIVFYDKFLAGDEKKDRGLAYYNRIYALYQLKEYRDIISTVEKGNLPPMDETQWDLIPIMVSKSQFNLQHYDEVYNSYYPENIKKYSSDDLFMFVQSSIAVGDVNTAADITGQMKKDTDAYYESMYLIANYYKKNNDLNLSSQYYSKIIEGGAPPHRADKVRVELSDIYYRNKQYNDAIATLTKVSEGEFSGSKNSLLALSFFKTGDTEKALGLSLTKIQSINASPYGEEVMKLNVDHYYGAHNLQKFGLFSDYLKQYKGKTDYVNYLSGKFYYDIRYYQNSLNYLYRLSGIDTQYGDEVNYYIGKIILFVYKNNNIALKYFQKAAMSANNESVFKWKSKINIALIDAELEDMEAVKMQLKDIIDNVQRGPTLNQAVNIKEYYGL